ncbi:MAG: hypothetical protein ACYTEX_16435 [Planctomycetota bacterium]
MDNFGGLVYVLFLTADDQAGLAGGDAYAQRLAQKPKVTVAGAKQLELVVG